MTGEPRPEALVTEPCGCRRYADGSLAKTCAEHTPVSCWNCDWPSRADRDYCSHCGVEQAVRRR